MRNYDDLLAIAEAAAAALALADEYLDGFIWISDPEYTELEGIKAASRKAQADLRQHRDVAQR